MKFDMFALPTIPGTLEDRAALRPIGRNNERYQQMLEEVRQLVIMADDMGFDAFSTTEHHFHSEGFEASVAPLLLYADLAARTKRIKFAPLGLVLPSWDPLRCAEELAVLDHLTQGRVIAGFARGYQDRWTNVLGQHYHVTGAPMDGSDVDNHNRRVFEEIFKIIKMAWTQDSIEYNSEYYSIPQPYEEGIRRWPVHEWTRSYGAPGEVDEEGVIRRISVIPKPYQQPHPPFWQPFSVSENTIRWTAKENILPWILISYPERFADFCRLYQEEAATVGRNLRLGQGVGAVRDISIGRTYEEAFEQGVKSTGFGFYTYFGNFGFNEAFRNPGEDAPVPLMLPNPEAVYQRMVDHDFALCGTVDDVKRKMESLSQCYGDGELEWFSWLLPQGNVALGRCTAAAGDLRHGDHARVQGLIVRTQVNLLDQQAVNGGNPSRSRGNRGLGGFPMIGWLRNKSLILQLSSEFLELSPATPQVSALGGLLPKPKERGWGNL